MNFEILTRSAMSLNTLWQNFKKSWKLGVRTSSSDKGQRYTRILVARRVSRESHDALVEGSNRWQSSFDFTVEEVRGTSVAVETGHGQQTSFDERQEKGVDIVNKEQSEDHDQEQRMHSTRTHKSCDANAR